VKKNFSITTIRTYVAYTWSLEPIWGLGNNYFVKQNIEGE